MKVAIVLGTRPEIIKLAPLIKQLPKKSTSVIFTGQHAHYDMSLRFIDQLGLAKPNHSMNISHTKPALQIADVIRNLSKILEKEKPDTVIVQGDTNTVLAAGITSLKSNIPLSHVEAGLRSYDWRMPEEHNRIEIDHISELLFAPTTSTKYNLISEKVHGKIFVTGNTIIDAINQFTKISKKYSKISIEDHDYVLMTLHRAENVDKKEILAPIIKAVIDSKQDFIFPIHPRTLKRLHDFNLYTKLKRSKNIRVLDPVGYFEVLELMKNCQFILTDSGGIQEEATAPSIRKKVIVVRKATDRPESVSTGFSEIAGTSYKGILRAIKKNSKNARIPARKSPFGSGNTTKLIIKHLKANI